MDFILTTGWEDGIAKLTEAIVKRLTAQQHVLWLVCGGSNIPAAVKVMSSISTRLSGNLTIGLTDERYGPVGHKDSNWQQLQAAGLTPKRARTLPVLQSGLDLDATVEHYRTELTEALSAADSVIGQFGIGEDGHIAGILPGSPAITAAELVTGYKSQSFTRLTMTFPAFSHVDVAYAFAFGESKRSPVKRLYEQTVAAAEQPSQILKTIPEAHLYNNQVGGHP